jgi:anaerobic magnesium-protoporphyrin IX monomethyl ester cyclase
MQKEEMEMKEKIKKTDCFFIGHNEMNFADYESRIKKMGVRSGAYRDLNLNYLVYNKTPLTALDIFNIFRYGGHGDMEIDSKGKPMTMGYMFSAAISYLSTYLSRRGLTFDFVNSFQDEKDQLKQKLQEENIILIAITTTLYVSPFPILEIIEFVKQHNSTARIVIGGPFISGQARALSAHALQDLFDSLGADYYVNSSQGETALLGIIQSLKNNQPLDSVNNIFLKNKRTKKYTATHIKRENNILSENMVNWKHFGDRAGSYAPVRTSISCPFSCSFCGFPQHAGRYQLADIEKLEEELNSLASLGPIRHVNFIDDTFNVPPTRFKKILKMMIKNKYEFTWNSHFRCQFADKETVVLMKESGCKGVFLGLESGNDKILKNMNKSVTVKQYMKGISMLKEFDLLTYGAVIIGFPGETVETVKDSIKLVEDSGIDFFRAQLWYCDTITPIWEKRDEFGLSGSQFEWTHNTMNSRDACDLMEEIFLLVENPIWVPQYNFEFETIFQLLQEGFSLDQVKQFIREFNRGIKEKLKNGSKKEVSFEVLSRLQAIHLGSPQSKRGGLPEESVRRNREVEADFEF